MRILFLALFAAAAACGAALGSDKPKQGGMIPIKYEALPSPMQWGENLNGVLTKLDTKDKAIALTFDACGSKGDGFDSVLFEYLEKENIPATFFLSGRWIDRHPAEFEKIASNPLFEIENHGLNHKPASVNGNSAYGIKGTQTPSELIEEVELNAQKIQELTGRKPVFYRSGTAYYDEIAVDLINGLGYKIAGFSVLGDMGATFSEAEVKSALLHAPAGSIAIFHINHPEKATGRGVMSAVPELRASGFKFVKLSDYGLK